MRYFWLIIFLMQVTAAHLLSADIPVEWAKIQGPRFVQIKLADSSATAAADPAAWHIEPEISIDSVRTENDRIALYTAAPFDLTRHYFLVPDSSSRVFLVPDGILDSLYSEKPLGYRISPDNITYRVFAPRAKWVRLVLFENYKDQSGTEYPMRRDADGVWEQTSAATWVGKYYGYRVWGPQGNGEMFDSTIVLADPYSPAVTARNHFTYPAKTVILPDRPFDWEGDNGKTIAMRDLIIYEMHIRDLTADASAGLPAGLRGTYAGLVNRQQKGGLPYILSLGVNAVELLPSQEYANLEMPYRNPRVPVFNTWNPYARNHWGYMTSYFFAPETYYASSGTVAQGEYTGQDGRQIEEFKKMVRGIHASGLAVLMDVVYNHVSQYDHNPLKYIDKFYYFRLNQDCSFQSQSGCGNDLKTERPMARRLILDSVTHWMKEYHIDGFRFDLANLLDWQTIDAIRDRARQINPGVVLIAEPWGGGYNPSGFSDHQWAAWNDQIRNGVKGQNPFDGRGFIFGEWQGENSQASLRRYITGSLRRFGGQYISIAHSVNYLASHDDNTLGDFIRLGLGDVKPEQRIANPDSSVRLTPEQLRLNKLAALFLLTSQGPVMIHEGQEYARSKVIAETAYPDSSQGKIDHNSYNKDNQTNWLNFRQAAQNRHLLEYYRGLIELRKSHPAFRRARPDQIRFLDQSDSLLIVYRLAYQGRQYLIMMNGNSRQDKQVELPAGNWAVLVDPSRAAAKPLGILMEKQVSIPPSSGMVLMQ